MKSFMDDVCGEANPTKEVLKYASVISGVAVQKRVVSLVNNAFCFFCWQFDEKLFDFSVLNELWVIQ